MLSTTNLSSWMIVSMLGMVLGIGSIGAAIPTVNADCDLPGEDHDDNNPSEKKAERGMDDGAGACKIAQKCDAMEWDVKISGKEMKEYPFYQNAGEDLKEELDEVAEDGHGADGVECYEIEYAIEEVNE